MLFPQIVVIGPWPYALVHQLYFCVQTLAQDVLALKVKSAKLLCPRCRQTKFPVKKARAEALKGRSLACGDYSCRGNTGDSTAQPERGGMDQSDSDSYEEEQGTLDMATLSCATWIIGLSRLTTPEKKRRNVEERHDVVRRTIEAASGATDSTSTIRKAHASRILERYTTCTCICNTINGTCSRLVCRSRPAATLANCFVASGIWYHSGAMHSPPCGRCCKPTAAMTTCSSTPSAPTLGTCMWLMTTAMASPFCCPA